MSILHKATLTPGKVDLVAEWIGAQRWYPGTGRPRLRRLDSWRLDDPAGEVGIETLVLLDESGPDPVVHQVPLTYRGAPLEGGERALVGEMEHSVLGHRWVYDAPHDPVYVDRLMALLRGRDTAWAGSRSETPEPGVVGVPHPAWPHDPVVATSRVHTGEQSNTSIVITPERGAPVILKIFRTLAAGENPDVTLQGALAAAQSPFVPASVGHVDGSWERADGQGTDRGHLAFAQEYLADTSDAWRTCLEVAATGAPFVTQARELGRATAQVHATLARALPTVTPDAQEVRQRVRAMRNRAGLAMSEAPGLAAHSARIRSLLDAAESADWPALQRIHGDFHLGQVLDSPQRGWILIDFEGEPLRPLAERNAPDSTLRDVAGLLRSLDYVAGTLSRPGTRTEPSADVRAWCTQAQQAFLDGYGDVGPDPRAHAALLTAFILDKALYEVVYEARNRPSWLTLPVDAIDRLLKETHP